MKNNLLKFIKDTFVFLSIILLSLSLINPRVEAASKIVNSKKLRKIATLDIIERESYISGFINKIIHAKGYVESVKKKRAYRRDYRITIVDNSRSKVDIRYHLYTDNDEYLDLLKKSDLFEFKGQFIIFTPLNSRGTSYVFDVILQDGAILVE